MRRTGRKFKPTSRRLPSPREWPGQPHAVTQVGLFVSVVFFAGAAYLIVFAFWAGLT
jgi:hypothetical protein